MIKTIFLVSLLISLISCAHPQPKQYLARGPTGFEDGVRTVLEIQAIEVQENQFFAGWQEDSKASYSSEANWMTPYNGNRRCVFGFKSKQGEWSRTLVRQNPEYSWSGNPAVFQTDDKNLVAVCMSGDAPFLGRGLLELSYSKDQGRSWSDWISIYKNESGSPDKSSLVRLDSTSFAVAFVDFQVQSTKSQDFFGKTYGVNSLKGQLMEAKVGFGSDGNITIESARPITIPDFVGTTTTTVSGYYTAELTTSKSGPWGVVAGPGKADALYMIKRGKTGAWAGEKSLVTGLQGPICRLAESKARRAVLCYSAHSASPVLLAVSKDSGRTWDRPIEVSPKGNLGALAFDSKGKLHVIWSQVKDSSTIESFRAVLKPASGVLVEQKSLIDYSLKDANRAFFGAYQTLLWSGVRQKFYAFLVGGGSSDFPAVKTVEFSP